MLAGAYTADGQLSSPVFDEAGDLQGEDVVELVKTICRRVPRLLRYRRLPTDEVAVAVRDKYEQQPRRKKAMEKAGITKS